MRARVLLIGAGGIAVAVASYAVLSPSGVSQLWKMRDEERALAADVAKARDENVRLADEVRVLQGNDAASNAVLGKRAREELGYVKADEVVLTTKTATATAATTQPTQPAPATTTTPPAPATTTTTTTTTPTTGTPQ